MMLICGECGAEIPEGMDFCPSCGCLIDKACRIDDSGHMVVNCPNCGEPCNSGDVFCGHCGVRLNIDPMMMIPMQKIDKRGKLALFMSIILGFFNIFGLGHLVMKQYSRGIAFLLISLVIWYMNGWKYTDANVLIMIVDICVFFYCLSDLMRIVYSGEKRRWIGPRNTGRRI